MLHEYKWEMIHEVGEMVEKFLFLKDVSAYKKQKRIAASISFFTFFRP